MVTDLLIERIILIVLALIGLFFIFKPSSGIKILNKLPFNRAQEYVTTKTMSKKDKKIYFAHRKKYDWLVSFIVGFAMIGIVILCIVIRGGF